MIIVTYFTTDYFLHASQLSGGEMNLRRWPLTKSLNKTMSQGWKEKSFFLRRNNQQSKDKRLGSEITIASLQGVAGLKGWKLLPCVSLCFIVKGHPLQQTAADTEALARHWRQQDWDREWQSDRDIERDNTDRDRRKHWRMAWTGEERFLGFSLQERCLICEQLRQPLMHI